MIDIFKKLALLLSPSDKWKLAGLLGLMIIASLLEVIGIGMIPLFISIVANPQRVLEMEHAGPVLKFFNIRDSADLLVFGGVVLVVVFLIKNIYIVMFRYVEAVFIYNRYSNVASRMFQIYMKSPYSNMLSKNSSEVLRNVTQETGIIIKQVITPLMKLVMNVILIAFTLALLFYVNPIITLAAVLLFGIAGGGFMKLIRQKVESYGKRAQRERMVMIQAVNEGVGGLKDIRVLQRTESFVRRFMKSVSRYSRAMVFRAVTRQATKPVLETVAVSGILLIALVLYWQNTSVEAIIPFLALFGAAAVRLLPAMREIVESTNSLRFHGCSVHAIHGELTFFEGLGSAIAPESDVSLEALPFTREIRFDSVRFNYPGCSAPAVQNLSIRVAKGEAVGLVGPSGAGKTTIVDLLLGILTPQEGEVTVDGVCIGKEPWRWWKNIGYISQFIFLTDDTLKRNIALGLSDGEIDDAMIATAIEAAQLTETVEALPQGIETMVGERGVRLSGGQRQRIGIARAIYGNPSVLIMDEATSSLDSGTEKGVIDAIEKLKGEKTLFIISHRITTVQKCDRLIVIKEGEVTDSGEQENFEEIDSDVLRQKLDVYMPE